MDIQSKAIGDTLVDFDANDFLTSGFQHTDMDYQLRQRNITNLVLAGLESHTCFESTARGTSEL